MDGEIVALDDDGRPVFNLLQNLTSESGRIRYFVFDLLCYENHSLMRPPLLKRREMLRSLIKFDHARVKIAEYIEASADQMLAAVREQRLEGIVGKRKDSVYELGQCNGVGSTTRYAAQLRTYYFCVSRLYLLGVVLGRKRACLRRRLECSLKRGCGGAAAEGAPSELAVRPVADR